MGLNAGPGGKQTSQPSLELHYSGLLCWHLSVPGQPQGNGAIYSKLGIWCVPMRACPHTSGRGCGTSGGGQVSKVCRSSVWKVLSWCVSSKEDTSVILNGRKAMYCQGETHLLTSAFHSAASSNASRHCKLEARDSHHFSFICTPLIAV